jgi:hypothetical protein
MNSNDEGDRHRTLSRRNVLLASTTLAAASAVDATSPIRMAQAQQPPRAAPSSGKPNILVIFGDDIGITNLSTYSQGLMGYETPNIDRIANEGLKFLH